VNNLINATNLSEAEPIWLSVARLSAGFHRMALLGQELVELDGVRQDIAHTQAQIRRDVAGAVLQSAIALKKAERAAECDATRAPDDATSDPISPQSDEWAGRLVRWADQFGRDLFRLPIRLLPSKKQGDNTPDRHKPK
jgi:hypothetical protein